MLSKKDRAKLIEGINIALTLYVDGKDNKLQVAKTIGQHLEVDFLDHFIEACIKD